MAEIAFVLESFPQLSETFILDQMRTLSDAGYSVHVIADRFNEYDEDVFGDLSFISSSNFRWKYSRVNSLFMGRVPWFVYSRLKVLFDFIADRQLRKYDLVVAHFGFNGLRLARSRSLKRFRTPIISIFHGYDVGIPLANNTLGSYECLFKEAKLILCVNEWFKKVLVNSGASSYKVKVHRMGVDIENINFKERDRKNLEIVSVCRLVEKKGINVALNAISELITERPSIPLKYKIIGDGPLRKELEEQVLRLKLTEHVTFLGSMPHSMVQECLDSSNTFLLPSVTARNGDVEGVPVSLMEAMASGATVVSSFHSGIPELIDNGVSGFLAKENDPSGLARALSELHDNPQEASKMALAGRSKVVADFNSSKLKKLFLRYVKESQ